MRSAHTAHALQVCSTSRSLANTPQIIAHMAGFLVPLLLPCGWPAAHRGGREETLERPIHSCDMQPLPRGRQLSKKLSKHEIYFHSEPIGIAERGREKRRRSGGYKNGICVIKIIAQVLLHAFASYSPSVRPDTERERKRARGWARSWSQRSVGFSETEFICMV